jgi:predicted flap endonuclease-1-like 5' DNA nuclease
MIKKKGLPWWAWVPFLPVLLALLLLWRKRRKTPPKVDVHRDSIPLPMEPRRPDDLTVLKGIGLKSASALNAAGIFSFAQVAMTSVDRLRQILEDAGLRLVDPSSWPEQASQRLGGIHVDL